MRSRLLLASIVVVALGLRVYHLTDRSIWYDEASSWQTAKFPLSELMESVRLNVHLPLYYVWLKGWMAVFGESPAALRGYSIAFGLLTVAGMDRFARELLRASSAGGPGDVEADERRFGLLVAAMVAASAYQVHASIEARMYTQGTALTAWGAWLLLRALREPGRAWPWAGFALACAGLLYTHHYALFTVAAFFVFLGYYSLWLAGLRAGTELRAVLLATTSTAVLLALVYLPGFLLLRTQTGRVRQDYWIAPMGPEKVSATFAEFVAPAPVEAAAGLGWASAAIFAGSCVAVSAGGRRGDYFAVTCALVPMIASAAISVSQPIWVARYFRFAHLFVLATVALAAWKLTRRAPGARAAACLVLVGGPLAGNVAFWNAFDVPGNPGPRGCAAIVLAGRCGDELVVALDHHQYFPLKYYLGGRARVRLLQSAMNPFWGGHLIRPCDRISPEQLEAELGRGVWLVSKPNSPVVPELQGAVRGKSYKVRYHSSLHDPLLVTRYARSGAGRDDRTRGPERSP